MTDTPRVLGKRYEVGELIGRGGMAQVHLGYDTRLSRKVAIKILRTDLARDQMFLARFRREAQSAAALNHPSIVSVYDTGEEKITYEDGRELHLPYIIMEFVQGRTVSSLLSDGDPVPIGEAVQITVGVLNALEYSHHEGIIHRDIKPGNVMLTPSGKVKVMDFGIARAIADSAATMTQTNSVVGTAQYLSPEQARGEVVDARSDLYSAGCLLYELLTGKPPFTGDSAVAVAYQHVSETPHPASLVASDIPDSIDRVVMKSLAKQREERYQSAADFRNDLISAAQGEGVDAPSVTSWRLKPVTSFPPTGTGVATDMMPTGRATTAMPAGVTTLSVSQSDPTSTGVMSTQNAKKRNRIMIALGILLIILAGVGIVYGIKMAGDTPIEPTETATTIDRVSVPNITGLDEREAKLAIESAGLEFKNGGTKDSDTIKQGEFVESHPQMGERVEKGSTVTVYFSSGPSVITVPKLDGMTTSEAAKELAAKGLTLGNATTVDDPSQEKDRIVAQDPAAGASATKGTAVNVSIASGNVQLPNVAGKNLDDAKVTLESLGLVVDETINYQETKQYTPGTVIAQSKSPGLVPRGTVVGLTVAEAPSEKPSATPSATSSSGSSGSGSSASGSTGNNG